MILFQSGAVCCHNGLSFFFRLRRIYYHGTKNFPADILAVRHESVIIPFRTTALPLLLILGFSSTMTNQYIRITMFGLIYQTDILQVHAVSQIWRPEEVQIHFVIVSDWYSPSSLFRAPNNGCTYSCKRSVIIVRSQPKLKWLDSYP